MRPSLEYECDPPTARLFVSGELDVAAHDELSDMFLRLALRGCTFVELDLSAATFIDAYALGRFRCEQRRLRKLNGDLRVVAASPWCTLICRLAQYDSLQVEQDGQRSPGVRDGVPRVHVSR